MTLCFVCQKAMAINYQNKEPTLNTYLVKLKKNVNNVQVYEDVTKDRTNPTLSPVIMASPQLHITQLQITIALISH